MALYERLLGRDDNGASVPGKIPVHQFQAVMAEFARGRMTGVQARAAVETISGLPLTAGEATEANTLTATIAGTAAVKLARAKEIDDVLLLGEIGGVVGYTTPTEIKTRLGV